MEEEAIVQLEAFKKMSNLKFIKLVYHNLQLSCSSNDDDMSACFSFKHLKYLEWDYFPCKSLDNIDMGNVVVIRLMGSKLEKLWEGANKSLKKLKILDVSYSSSLIKTGSFIGLDNLEELDLNGCSNLKELDSSIGCLQKLVRLDLSGCERLKRLFNNSHPNSRCQLHQLTSIVLSCCTNLKSIPNLPPNIEYLYAEGCRNLVNLPSNISELQNLKGLLLNGCLKLGSEGFTQVTGLRNLLRLWMDNCNVSQVSSGIGNLVSLRHLSLSVNTFSTLPASFSNLSKLESLYINDCSQLQLLPPLPSQLKYTQARNCVSLDVMRVDSTQKTHTFPSNPFKESRLTSSEGLHISLSGEEVPEWCTYRNNSGNVLSFVAPIQFHHTKICGIILSAIRVRVTEGINKMWASLVIYNKTKGTSHRCNYGDGYAVMFYPLNDKTLVVEAGDIVELQFDDNTGLKSSGVRLVYKDDVVDSGLVLKDVRDQPTVSC